MQSHGDQIPLMDILGTGDDLYGLLAADIHLTDPHVVGVGMADHGENLADDHVFDLSIHPLPGFHLLTEDGHGFNKFFIAYFAQIHEVFIQPFSVQSHY